MSNPYYSHSSAAPVTQTRGVSATMRSEFDSIAAGFDAVSLAIGANAAAWVSGTTYAIGDVVYSPIDYQDYRRKTDGAGTTDPSADTTNWEFRKLTLSSEVPQNSQSAAYTLVLADAGKHILHPSADTTARVWTIPANSSVAFRIGTTITFVNQNGAGIVTIAITTDTMRLAVLGTTGSRTLAANGTATALKTTATEWVISGMGLS
jgi:hypothetical protein